MPPLFDIVYILREDIVPNELRYSLRSIERNFPHRKVWFVCGQPEGLYPDGRIRHKQHGQNKWENTLSSLFEIIKCEDITDDFFIFNDDFFVMKPFRGTFINYTAGTLEKRIRDLTLAHGRSPYIDQLVKARNQLLFDGFDAISFAVHMPFLMNKELARGTLTNIGSPMFRSIYGNRNRVPFVYHEDVKIYDRTTAPDPEADYLSTMEDSFDNGRVGQFIRDAFPDPSRFEVPFEEQKRQQLRERYTEEGDDRV